MPVPPFKDDRLQQRYRRMVDGHLSPAQRLACGLRAAPGDGSTWAAVQGAYRFLHNSRVTLPGLMLPLLEVARQAVPEACERYALAIHDWSLLRFRRHHAKLDRLTVGQQVWKEGYELHTCLLVGDRAGDPLAPVSLSLHATDGAHCTRAARVRPILSVLDEVDPVMTFVQSQRFGKPVVHILDAEADSVAHYRQWSEHPDRWYVVRADDRLAEWQGSERKCSQIHENLQKQGAFQHARQVQYQGQAAEQWVAEAAVQLLRPGQQNRADGSRRRIPGPPLALRLVIAEVRCPQDQVRATWYLLTNLPQDVDAATIALWYYWRWRIETYFKLLKSAGFDLEQWQQETAAALTRRLLVASMACVIVWQLARSTTPQAEETRRFLVQLSGRQMARGKTYTQPALLVGLWQLLQLQHILAHYDQETLQRMATLALPHSRAGPASEDV